MNLAMNALLVEERERKVLFDPGTADFLPHEITQGIWIGNSCFDGGGSVWIRSAKRADHRRGFHPSPF